MALFRVPEQRLPEKVPLQRLLIARRSMESAEQTLHTPEGFGSLSACMRRTYAVRAAGSVRWQTDGIGDARRCSVFRAHGKECT